MLYSRDTRKEKQEKSARNTRITTWLDLENYRHSHNSVVKTERHGTGREELPFTPSHLSTYAFVLIVRPRRCSTM